MRVLINLHSTLGNLSGVGHYTTQLYRCLKRLAPGEVVPTFPECLSRLHGKIAGHGAPSSRTRVRHVTCKLIRGVVRTWMAARVKVGRYDMLHEPNFIPPISSVPSIATLHDLSVLLHPEWHPAERVAWFEKNLGRLLSQCVHFLTVSASARREIIATLNVPPSRVSHIYNGIRPWLRPLPESEVLPVLRGLGLPPRYVLYVGTIEPRKNVLTLLHAYCDLPDELRQRYPLVLAGGWGWKTEDIAAYFHDVARHKGVVRLGYVPESALGALYNGARALAFPSLYEGFGLPPVEMMACGGAVLASTASAVAEVAGGQALLIEPSDMAGWRDGLQRVLTDDDYWRQLRRGAVAHARPYTWDACAADTLTVYRAVATGHFDCAPADLSPIHRAAS